MPETCPRTCPVDLGGFDQIPGDILQRGQKVDHVKPGMHPKGGKDQSRHHIVLGPGKIEGPIGNKIVEGFVQQTGMLLENRGKEHRDEREAHEGRGEKYEAKIGPTLQAGAIQQQGQAQCDRELNKQ